jgi:ABC-type sugar transport system ATPase subunit
MQEIYRIADRITVLRDGTHVATATATEMPTKELVRAMVGRDLSQQFARRDKVPAESGKPRLVVQNLRLRDPANSARELLRGVSFNANAGEILAFAGLQGCGASELLNALFGTYGKLASGTVRVAGAPHGMRSPREAISRRIALLTNDRKETGAVLNRSITENMTLATLWAFSPGGWIRARQERDTAEDYRKRLSIRLRSLKQPISTLSGGNQQKVLLAKWLVAKPNILLLDEPTRGVDVGAKHEIYDLIFRLRDQGCTILLVTTEMPELLSLADRILVLHRGEITAELAGATATQEQVLAAAMGESEAEASVA